MNCFMASIASSGSPTTWTVILPTRSSDMRTMRWMSSSSLDVEMRLSGCAGTTSSIASSMIPAAAVQKEHGPPPPPIGKTDDAPHELDQPFADRQAQAGAAFLARIGGIRRAKREKMRLRKFSGMPGPWSLIATRTSLPRSCSSTETASPAGEKFGSVGNQIGRDLEHALYIDVHDHAGQVLGERELDVEALRKSLVELDRLFHQRIERHRLGEQRQLARTRSSRCRGCR